MTIDKRTGTADAPFSEEELIAMLAEVYEIRRQRDTYSKAYESAKKPLGAWLEKMPEGYQLRDGETGTFAQFGSGGDNHALDFDRLLEERADGREVIAWLARKGCLRLDWSRFKEIKTTAAEGAVAERHVYSDPRSRRLIVDREKR